MFDLDKPMYQYLPNSLLEHDQRYKLITPRMVLNHSSGLENWKANNNPDTLEIVSNPGEKYTYSGEAYNYLSKVIALILNKPYEQYLSEMELKPLHLKNSRIKFEKKKFLFFHYATPSDYATGHKWFGEEVKKVKNKKPIPSSYNNVTAEDYAHLVTTIFDRKHLSEKSIRDILNGTTVTAKKENGHEYSGGFQRNLVKYTGYSMRHFVRN